jgi:hypothetical protein
VAIDYVRGKRKRYFGPFAFLVVIVALASAEVSFTGFRAVNTNNPNVASDFLQGHLNLVYLAQLPLLASFSRLLDMYGGFNFAEHLVLSAYATSMHVLFFIVLVVPVWYLLSPSDSTGRILYSIYLPIWPIYFGFATSQFLQGKRAWSWCKGILAAILAWASTQALAFLMTNF